MPKDFHDEPLTFSLNEHHKITLRGAEMRFVCLRNGSAYFHPAENADKIEPYTVTDLNRMNRAGEISVVPYGLLPQHLRPIPVPEDEDAFIAGLRPKTMLRLSHRYAMVRGFEDLKAKGAITGSDKCIKDNMKSIQDAAEPYFQEQMTGPDYNEKFRLWEEGTGRKPRTPVETKRPGPCSARSLRDWASRYRKGGKAALIDRSGKQGNVLTRFTLEETALLHEVIRAEYLTLERKSKRLVERDVKIRFNEENNRRASKGLPKFKVPGRDAVTKAIRRLDVFSVMVARHGFERAMQIMRPVLSGVEVERPLQRVEMDEQKIDVHAILAQSGLMHLFSADELDTLGLLDKTKRWWLVLAIDCRTRCILGMVLTSDPRSSAALKCLRMVVSDKGDFANMAGAKATWSIYGTPEMLVTDNGSAFKSLTFTRACTDLGITAVQTIAGMPSMRGIGERIFGTLSSSLMPRLSGRTFSNVSNREDYDAEKRASLTLEDIASIIVRYAVDVYHNSPHEGLGGRTPLDQWELDLRNHNAPLRTAPTNRHKRIALGVSVDRVLQKDGIRVMNVQYQSEDLAKHFLKRGRQYLEVRWSEEDIGTIEVHIEGGWRSVPAISATFRGVHASDWLRTCRSLRAKDPKRKEWEEEVIAEAILHIERVNRQAKLASNMLDHAWTNERLEKVEKDALASFSVVARRDKTSDPSDGHGRLIVPISPAELDDPHVRIQLDRHAAEPVASGARDNNVARKAGKPAEPEDRSSTEPGTRTRSKEDDRGYDLPL